MTEQREGDRKRRIQNLVKYFDIHGDGIATMRLGDAINSPELQESARKLDEFDTGDSHE